MSHADMSSNVWNNLTHFIKSRANWVSSERVGDERLERPVTRNAENAAAVTNTSSVMSCLSQQHANPPMFNLGSTVNLANTSPPTSPSKGPERAMSRRSLKENLAPSHLDHSTAEKDLLSPGCSLGTPSSPVKRMPTKIRASLQIDTFTQAAQVTKIAAPPPPQPLTPTTADQRGDIASTAATDTQPPGAGSIRSILRDRNTPRTGQSVRFFSRDVYRVITPDVSEGEIDQDAIPGVNQKASLFERLQDLIPENGVNSPVENMTECHLALISQADSAINMFSPPGRNSYGKSHALFPFQPRHPPRRPNIPSPSSSSAHSHSDPGSTSYDSQSLSSLTMLPPPADMSNLFDVSQELSLPGIPVSEELLNNTKEEVEEVENEESGEEKTSSVDITNMKTIGHDGEPTILPLTNVTPNQTASTGAPRTIFSSEGTVLCSPTDTIRTHGRTPSHPFPGAINDCTSITMFFTPDESRSKVEKNTASLTPESGSMAWPSQITTNGLGLESDQMSQLVIAQDMTAESQLDLVASLRSQLELQRRLAAQFEIDLTARDNLVSLLSSQLQKAEADMDIYKAEVERRQGAMRVLQRTVGELEKICCGLGDEVERSLEESFERSVMDEVGENTLVMLQSSIGQLKGELKKMREGEAKLREERDALNGEVERLENEVKVLKEEVKIQWAHAENAVEMIKELEGEKEALAKSVETLRDEAEGLGANWKESELKRAELEKDLRDVWATNEEIERERDQLIEDVNLEHDNVEKLTRSEQEHGVKFAELKLDHRYTTDKVTHLKELLDEREARIIEREQEAEDLRERMRKMEQEHGRFIDKHGRNVDEIFHMEEASRWQMQDIVKRRAKDGVAIGSMKDHLGFLADENQRLRIQVHDLKQESTDKDIKILQFTKARAQDQEDKEGLNIALDSKQQELELLKRKMGVKGTGGSTPTPNRVGLPELGPRRQSVAFATPFAPRQKHSMRVSIPKATLSADTPSNTRLRAGLPGNCGNGSVVPHTVVKSACLGTVGSPGPRHGSMNANPLSASVPSILQSTSTLPRAALPTRDHWRSSSFMSAAITVSSEAEDKENAVPATATR